VMTWAVVQAGASWKRRPDEHADVWHITTQLRVQTSARFSTAGSPVRRTADRQHRPNTGAGVFRGTIPAGQQGTCKANAVSCWDAAGGVSSLLQPGFACTGSTAAMLWLRSRCTGRASRRRLV
jgi:hypothetical protein